MLIGLVYRYTLERSNIQSCSSKLSTWLKELDILEGCLDIPGEEVAYMYININAYIQRISLIGILGRGRL